MVDQCVCLTQKIGEWSRRCSEQKRRVIAGKGNAISKSERQILNAENQSRGLMAAKRNAQSEEFGDSSLMVLDLGQFSAENKSDWSDGRLQVCNLYF